MARPKDRFAHQPATMQFNDDELLTPSEQKIFQDQRSMLQLRKIDNEKLRISVRVAGEGIQKVRDEINANNEVLSQWQDITVSRTRETRLAEQIRRGVEAEVADAQKERQPLTEMEPDLMQQLKNAENKYATTKNGLKASKEKLFADRGENERTKSEMKKLEEENDGLLNSTNNHSQHSAENQRLTKEVQDVTTSLQKSNAEMEARIGELRQQILRLSDEKVEIDKKYETKKPQIAELKNDIDKHQRDIKELQGHTFRLQEHYANFRESQELFNRISNHDRILADVGNSPTMNHMIFRAANVQRVLDAISVEERAMSNSYDQNRSRPASSEPIPRLLATANRNRNGLETRPGSSNQTSHQHGGAPQRFSQPAQGDRGTESTPPAPGTSRGSMANVPRGRRSIGPVARNPVRR